MCDYYLFSFFSFYIPVCCFFVTLGFFSGSHCISIFTLSLVDFCIYLQCCNTTVLLYSSPFFLLTVLKTDLQESVCGRLILLLYLDSRESNYSSNAKVPDLIPRECVYCQNVYHEHTVSCLQKRKISQRQKCNYTFSLMISKIHHVTL